ncbi:MAG: HAMP domain-containing sensor histidine kinase [Thermonemataceae bacterium]|nr:HAMP domain-containing sensor histidine kinase [Thermonemataceae bacterium]
MSHTPYRKLTLIYIIALAFVALVNIISYLLVSEFLVTDPDNPSDRRSHIGRMINFNGACATYSQELGNYVLLLDRAPHKDSAITLVEQIESKLEILEKAYNGLQKGDKDYGLNERFNTPEIEADFKNTDVYYEPLIKDLKEIIRLKEDVLPNDSAVFFQKVKNMQSAIQEQAREFSNKMLDLNFTYDQKAADELSHWGRIEFWLTVLTLVILFVEAFFIFRPAVKTIKTYFEELQSKNKDLAEAYSNLQEKEQNLRLTAENLAKSNTDLLASQKKLEESNLAKNKFFSIIVHDLKSPLNSLKALTNLLYRFSDKITKEEIQQTAEDLNNSIDKLFDFINNLLTWAKLQMQEVGINAQVFNLKDLVDRQLQLFKIYAQSKNITLKYVIAKEVQVYADPNYVDMILRNLVSNAMKFTPEGGEVKVTAKTKNDFVEISVADTGIGIAPDVIKKIFALDNKHITQGTLGEKGTGLGLLLSKEFVEKSAGTISVQSEIGKGSVFSFTLPISKK